jgi:hypothetical protein
MGGASVVNHGEVDRPYFALLLPTSLVFFIPGLNILSHAIS